MANLSDELTQTFPCPYCSHEFTESLIRLMDDPAITCPACGKRFKHDISESMQEATDKLERVLDNIIKRKLGSA